MEWKFENRIVTKIGTVYSHYIGNSRTTSAIEMDKITPEAEALKGTTIIIGGIESKVLDVQLSQRCNLTEMNYYVNILTDEEYESLPESYNI